jgi:hypothetical protein
VRIWPLSTHVAVSGLDPVPSSTYIRMAHTLLVAPAAKYTYHRPSMKWISGAQMWAPMTPLLCLRQMTVSAAVDRPWRVVARRRTIRSYSGTVAVK